MIQFMMMGSQNLGQEKRIINVGDVTMLYVVICVLMFMSTPICMYIMFTFSIAHHSCC